MPNFVTKKIIFCNLILISFLLVSCSEFRRVFRMSYNERMQEVSANHHEFCISRGLDFGKDDLLKNELYWRCRVILAQNRLKLHSFDIKNLDRTKIDREYVYKMKTKFHLAYEQSNQFRNNILNDLDHNKCVEQGYDLNSLDKVEVEKYFACRRRRAAELQLIPPYNKISYYDRPFDSYSHLFGLNKKLDEGIKEAEQVREKYPHCVRLFDIVSDEFQACKSDYDSHVQCLKNIESTKKIIAFEDRETCQKLSYVRFPDSLIKYDNQTKTEIKNRNDRADINYKNSLLSLGLTEEDIEKFHFVDKDEEKNKKEKNKTKNDAKNFNSKNELYSRVEVAKLRQKFISYCLDDSTQRLDASVNDMTGQCNMIIVKWEH